MIKNFDKNKVEVMGFGSNGHYPIPLEKDIVIVQVSVPCYEVGDEVCTYLFQILVPKDDTYWKSDYANSDGTPTVEFANWIIENHPEFNISDVLDKDSRIYFEFVDSLPAINI